MAGFLDRLSYARSLCITAPLVFVATGVMGSISLVSSLFDSSGRIQHACARLWARMVLADLRRPSERFRRFRACGATFPTFSSSTIRATWIFLSCLPRFQFHFRLRQRRSFFEFRFSAGICAVPVIFQSTDKILMRPSNHSVARAKGFEAGTSLVFFPEGGTSLDGSIKPFKGGGFVLAGQSQAEVVPVTIRGSRAVLVPKTYHVRGGPVEVILGNADSFRRRTRRGN